MARTLIITDSRGKYLQPCLSDHKDIGIVKVLVFRGVGFGEAMVLSADPIRSFRPTLVIIMMGICDLTRRDKATTHTWLRFTTVEESVDYVMAQAHKSLSHIRSLGSYRVSYATLTGLDLSQYNLRVQHLSPPQPDLQQAQNILNNSVLEINRRIIELNKITGLPTTWTASYVHDYFKHRYHHYYNRLSDGCHPTPNAVTYWANQMAKTIRQTC